MSPNFSDKGLGERSLTPAVGPVPAALQLLAAFAQPVERSDDEADVEREET